MNFDEIIQKERTTRSSYYEKKELFMRYEKDQKKDPDSMYANNKRTKPDNKVLIL